MAHPKIDIRVRELEVKGFGVLERSETSATLVKNKKVKHWLHILLTLVTGWWLIVYLWILGNRNTRIELEIEGMDVLRESKSNNKSGRFLAVGAVGLLTLAFIGAAISPFLPDSGDRFPRSSSTPSQQNSAPATTGNAAKNDSSECVAALRGNERFVTVINAVQSGNYDATKLVRDMQSIEDSLDNAWETASSSGLRNGLLEQANNIGLARLSLGNGDISSFDFAVSQFIANSGYFRPYCD